MRLEIGFDTHSMSKRRRRPKMEDFSYTKLVCLGKRGGGRHGHIKDPLPSSVGDLRLHATQAFETLVGKR